jgi:hypothetical protein
MSIKNRLSKLETVLLQDYEDMQIAVFPFVAPQVEPLGYVCDGITIIREPGESVEDLQQRAQHAITWPPGTSCKFFYSLE